MYNEEHNGHESLVKEPINEGMFKRAFIVTLCLLGLLFCIAVYIDNQNDKLQSEIYQIKRELAKKTWQIKN